MPMTMTGAVSPSKSPPLASMGKGSFSVWNMDEVEATLAAEAKKKRDAEYRRKEQARLQAEAEKRAAEKAVKVAPRCQWRTRCPR